MHKLLLYFCFHLWNHKKPQTLKTIKQKTPRPKTAPTSCSQVLSLSDLSNLKVSSFPSFSRVGGYLETGTSRMRAAVTSALAHPFPTPAPEPCLVKRSCLCLKHHVFGSVLYHLENMDLGQLFPCQVRHVGEVT